jgi:hypothetical protein
MKNSLNAQSLSRKGIEINCFATLCLRVFAFGKFLIKQHWTINTKKMTGKMTVFEKKNPGNPSTDAQWHAGVKSDGNVTLKSLRGEISERCTVIYADTWAIPEGLTQVLIDRSIEGQIVRSGDFGSFRLDTGSNNAVKEEFFHQSMIRTGKVRSIPEAT